MIYKQYKNQCPYCNHDKYGELEKRYDSNIVCLQCGKIFKSLNLSDKEEAGIFTGHTSEIPHENLYKISNKK
jgi:DNA-directed RNA polymerase subunit RPC12/RpoP